MRNIKLVIEYHGKRYSGWQLQKDSPTVQGALEDAIFKLTNKRTKLIGASRTDSGVHACGQVANFKTSSKLPLRNIRLGLNSYLHGDISVFEAEDVSADFHSRFSAKSKKYQYLILNREARDPLQRQFVWHVPYKLNISRMRKEVSFLVGKHDFRSFQAADKIERSSERRVKEATLRKRGDLLVFEIEADGFLYHMVRNIVGSLVEIGRGRFPSGYMKTLIKARDRSYCGPTAPAHGLRLLYLKY